MLNRLKSFTTLPRKYDASSAASIINILLKENNDGGTNANPSLIAGYGHREKIGTNVNLFNLNNSFRLGQRMAARLNCSKDLVDGTI